MSTELSIDSLHSPCATPAIVAGPHAEVPPLLARWRALRATWRERECRRSVVRLAEGMSAAERRDLGLQDALGPTKTDGWRILSRTF